MKRIIAVVGIWLIIWYLIDGRADKKENEFLQAAQTHPNWTQWANTPGYTSDCGDQAINLTPHVNIIAENLEKEELLYNSKKYTDCSGIFIRVLDSLEKRCPEASYLDPATYRSSRDIALWYDKQDQLELISAPKDMHTLIRPGAVMFYAPPQAAVNGKILFGGGGIHHVGIVTEVQLDKEGVVQSYTLFHGRSEGKIASITRYHKRSYRNRKYAPYGNGAQKWVAIAPVIGEGNLWE
ncbi:MAG: hypothetical protein AAF655_23030 [Bacteroidota bacterium]